MTAIRRWRAWFQVLALVGASACSTPLPAPTLAVPLSNSGWGEFVLHVYDDTGLITGARQNEQPAAGGETVTAFPERQELELVWAGGACAHRPILNVTGDAAQLRLELEPGPSDPQLPFLSCPAVGIRLGVTLALSAPVSQPAVTIQVTH